MYLKVMSKSSKGHKFILCIIDEVMNYLITLPVCQSKSEKIKWCLDWSSNIKLLYTRLYNNGLRQCIMSSLIHYLFKKFDIKLGP